MCRQGGEKLCVAIPGAFNQVISATIWWGSGRRSDTTLISFFARSQGRCWQAWWLCYDGCPGLFCRKSAGTFVAGKTGFFSAGTRVGRVPDWLLVIRTLGTPNLGRVILRGFLWDSFPCSMAPLAGVATWLGSRGAVGEFDRMVARALSFGGMVLCRPWNGPSGAKETR